MNLTTEQLQEALQLLSEEGSVNAAARRAGIARSSMQNRIAKAKERFLEGEAEEVGFEVDAVSNYWIKTKTGSFHVRRDAVSDYSRAREDFLAEAASHAPVYSAIRHQPGPHLLVVDPADVHVGKLCVHGEVDTSYGTEEAIRRLRSGITNLLAKAKVHGVERIVFVLGNDILHTDNPHRTTTSGTPQDTDGHWWQNFTAAKRAYIAIIEELTQVAPVHLVHCASNHDFISGWMLADTICSWFARNPNVIAEQGSVSIAHRKYIQFGSNLIGLTHGDGAKESDLASLMQYEAREAWGQCAFSYLYVHHRHHKQKRSYGKEKLQIEKDHIGVTVVRSANSNPLNSTYVEVVRSPSPPDRWHHTNGYVNQQAIECFLHHPDKGQVARFTEFF